MDIAELGLSIRSDGVVIADKRLDGLARGAKKAETATERLIRKTEKMNATMKKMGRNMAMFATLPIIGLMGGAIKAFANFDEAMVSSMAIMGDLSETMQRDMADTAKKVALSTAFSAKQAADSYYFLASAGLSAAASIAALPKVAAFAQAGTFDMAKATDILTDAQSALGLVMEDPIENMEKMVELSDVLVKANTIANASVQQFGEALTNKAGTAMKLLNIDIEAGVAVLAAWADQGIKATEAGEKFNIVTRDLQTAYRKNTEEFKKMGVEVFKDGKFQNMADIIGQLEVALGPMTVEMQGTTLALMGFQDRSVMAIKSLLGLSDKIRGYEKDLRKAGGITEDVANKQMMTFNKQAGLMKDRLVGIGITLGEKLIPLMGGLKETLDDFLDWISDAVDTFTSYDVETQKMILGAIAFTAALGPLLIVLGFLVSAITTLAPLVVGISALMITFAGTLAIGAFAVAAGLAIAELAIIIGDKYVKSIEDAIEVTGDFQIALNTIDIDILSRNLRSVDDKMNQFLAKKKSLQKEIDDITAMRDTPTTGRGSTARYAAMSAELAKLNALQEQNNRNIENQITLRDSIEERLYLSISLEKEMTEATQELSAAMKELAENMAWLDSMNLTGLTGDELEELTEWWHTLRAEMDPAAEATRQFELAQQMLTLAIQEFNLSAEEQAAAIAQLTANMNEASGNTELMDWWKDLEAAIDPVAAATAVFKEEVAKLDKVIAAGKRGAIDRAKAIAFLKKEMNEASGATAKATAEQEKFLKTMAKFKQLKAMIDPAEAAMQRFNEALDVMDDARDAMEARGVFMGEDYWDDMADGLERATLGTETLGESLERAGALAGDALRLIQSSMKENTKEYEAMNVAIQVANVAKAIGAVLTQAQGDPYTAFARMAAMAAAVAALGVSIASFSSAGDIDPTEERQKLQGAGSLLGDAEAKSESIMNALDITADATSELVGINRGMLSALTALKNGLTGATTQLLRGGVSGEDISIPDAKSAGWVSLISGGGILDMIGLGFISDFLSKILGGKTKLLDTGLEIEGGAITDLINEVMVRAFADVKSKKWFGGKYKFGTLFEELDESVGKQLALVFGSIVDTVMEAALALGIPLSAIEERLAAFEVETQKISMEDMTGAEQQEALLAVFSKIFDDLAIDIVPFIDQFQKVGEGLGETLVRVATSVQVMQEALKMLGIGLDVTDPEKFAQIAVGMMEMASGIDQFITQLQNFVSKFATEEWQNSIAVEAVIRGFEQLDITLPETRKGLWNLVQGLDLTTEAGRRQLAIILELTGSLDTYYDILEDIDKKRIQQLKDFAGKFAPTDWFNNVDLEAVTQGFEQLGITLPDTRDSLWDLVQGLDLTTEAGREQLATILELTDSLDRYYSIREQAFDAEIAALLHIQAIAEGVADSLKALRDRIIGDTSTDEENYNRFKAEADQLAIDLATMTDPDLIAETVAEIERLTSLAWGLLDESQKTKMADDFLTFLLGVEDIALARLGIAADEAVAGTEFTPEEILLRFNELVTDPLILVAGIQEMAALKLDVAADKLLAVVGADFSIETGDNGVPIQITAIDPIPVAEQVNTADIIEKAVQVGMEAGAAAMIAAATSIVATGDSANRTSNSSAKIIARAVSSIPSRIVVEVKESEFS